MQNSSIIIVPIFCLMLFPLLYNIKTTVQTSTVVIINSNTTITTVATTPGIKLDIGEPVITVTPVQDNDTIIGGCDCELTGEEAYIMLTWKNI